MSTPQGENDKEGRDGSSGDQPGSLASECQGSSLQLGSRKSLLDGQGASLLPLNCCLCCALLHTLQPFQKQLFIKLFRIIFFPACFSGCQQPEGSQNKNNYICILLSLLFKTYRLSVSLATWNFDGDYLFKKFLFEEYLKMSFCCCCLVVKWCPTFQPPHGLEPVRPSKNTGMDCHFILQVERVSLFYTFIFLSIFLQRKNFGEFFKVPCYLENQSIHIFLEQAMYFKLCKCLLFYIPCIIILQLSLIYFQMSNFFLDTI